MTDKESHMSMLLKELGDAVGLPGLGFDESFRCTLAFDERTRVRIEYNVDTDALALYSELGFIDPLHATEVARRLCEANLFWSETGGATLGLDDDLETVVLYYGTSGGDLDYRTFENLMEEFVGIAVEWQTRLSALQEMRSEERETDGAPVGFHFGMLA